MQLECYLPFTIVVMFFTAIQAFTINSQNDARALGRNGTFFRVKREDESCSFNEHECADGLCIRPNPECDGIFDCGDGSDEAFSLCRTKSCRINEFRCNYGACIHRVYVCDGNRDCVDNSDELLPRCTGRVWIVGEQFKCRSGQLIPLQGRCNGIVDCKDGTDESVAACAELVCHPEQFQCEYGGCVEGAAMCNGTAECRDGSDELLEICGKTTLVWTSDLENSTADAEISVRKCVLPQQPENGIYQIVSETDPQNADYLYLEYICYPGFKLVGEIRVVCWRGVWPELPHCVPASGRPSNVPDLNQGSSELENLPSDGYNNNGTEKETCTLTRHESIEYYCYDEEKGVTRPCGTEEANGTIVRPQCKKYYYSPVELSYMKCSGGAWSSGPICTPECGTLTGKVTPLASEGELPQYSNVPWHVGVYRRDHSSSHYEQICGGSLITSTMVLSAAHCFWDEKLKHLDEEEKYALATGKLHSGWDDPKDEIFAQKSNVSKIVVPDLYRGIELDYHHDIAVVVATQPFTYKLHVRPVCLDFKAEFNAEQLKEGCSGKLAGWSFNTDSHGSESKELKIIELPYVDEQNCLNQTSRPYLHYNVSDRICAGSLEGEALCRGDSGGGLSFASNISGMERYYLRGIASTSPLLKKHISCNVNSFTSFTTIIQYEEFIKQYLYT